MDWKSHRVDALLEQALLEDKAVSDATTNITIDQNLRASASIIARQELVVAGLGAVPRFLEIFARLDPRPAAHTRFDVISHPEIFDGVRVHKGQVLAVIRHNARVLLSCERVILNLMQHLSGIATLTRQYVDAIQGTKARVLDTRKTVPGMRALEKYAVLCGGGTNHRLDLSSGILIKNNHISLGGGLRAALTNALEKRKPGNRIEVEVRTQKELEEALEYGARGNPAGQYDTCAGARRRWSGFARKTAGFRLRRRAELCLRIFAHTPKRARTSSAWARLRTPPRPRISRCALLRSRHKRVRPCCPGEGARRHYFRGKIAFFFCNRIDQHRCAGGCARLGRLMGQSFLPMSRRRDADAAITGGTRLPAKGLYVSVLLRPDILPAYLPMIPLVTGLAAAWAVKSAAGLNVDIRWPNDLLIGDRKTGGILVESKTDATLPLRWS